MDKYLFKGLDPARYGQGRRRRRLFLGRLLAKGAEDKKLNGDRQAKAHEILVKWADLELSGKLKPRTESTLEGEFLNEVFGEALGYKLFSKGEERWDIEAKYSAGDGTADAAAGEFKHGQRANVRAVIELKGPTVNVDKDKSQGRTPVQQCWDYLYALPDCPWGIVCNIVSFRLYHRNETPQAYELFTLQELRNRDIFNQFYYIFQRGGLLPTAATAQRPRADMLLVETNTRQRDVGEDLYKQYQFNRLKMVEHLKLKEGKGLDEAIKIAQKLLDRIIFVAFCEDRELLPAKALRRAFEDVPPFSRVVNPRWQNFVNLFASIDKGNKEHSIPPFNGGLFRHDPEVDDLQLDDTWTEFFKNVGEYDFRDEVNVDVLGHLFERSINDLEKIRLGVLLGGEPEPQGPRMQRSAERKRGGIYYTPPEFTGYIVDKTIGPVVEAKIKGVAEKYKLDPEKAEDCKDKKKLIAYCTDCIEAIRTVKIVDPACGSGAFLIRAYEWLEGRYFDFVRIIAVMNESLGEKLHDEVANHILHDNLYGVDLSQEAVEITQLALWIRSARRGRTLEDLSHNILCGNSLIEDEKVDARALPWKKAFKEVFDRDGGGFDCVIGNPPWERIKLQEREFFDQSAPEIASATNAAKRRKLIEKLEKENPELYQKYVEAGAQAERTSDYIRESGSYPLTGKGDINLYAAFAELASRLVGQHGRVGILVPSGIATEHTTRDFWGGLVEAKRIFGLYDFENTAPIFPDVHRSYKFCVLLFGGREIKADAMDFVFFAHEMADLDAPKRHIELSAKDIELLNPNTKTCPIFQSKRDAELIKKIYRRVPVLWDRTRKEGGNPWGIKFMRMFDQTNDAEHFQTADELKKAGFKLDGANWKKGKTVCLPLYEAKMFRPYDHRFGSVYVEEKNWVNQGQTVESTSVQYQNPEFSVLPRWWADSSEVKARLPETATGALLAFRDITRATDSRTMLAAFIPYCGVVNTAPIMVPDDAIGARQVTCLAGNLNSLALDFVVKCKISHMHLNFFIVEQLPVFTPDFYEQKCPWDGKQTLEKWISERVLKLTCTANDMLPLAKAAGFKEGVHKWRENDRRELMAELDAAYFLLYGIDRDDAEYILSTFSGAADKETGLLAKDTPFELVMEKYDELREKVKKG